MAWGLGVAADCNSVNDDSAEGDGEPASFSDVRRDCGHLRRTAVPSAVRWPAPFRIPCFGRVHGYAPGRIPQKAGDVRPGLFPRRYRLRESRRWSGVLHFDLHASVRREFDRVLDQFREYAIELHRSVRSARRSLSDADRFPPCLLRLLCARRLFEHVTEIELGRLYFGGGFQPRIIEQAVEQLRRRRGTGVILTSACRRGASSVSRLTPSAPRTAAPSR